MPGVTGLYARGLWEHGGESTPLPGDTGRLHRGGGTHCWGPAGESLEDLEGLGVWVHSMKEP